MSQVSNQQQAPTATSACARVLVVTNMYPTADHPFDGTFVEQQLVGLRQIGLELETIHLSRRVEGRGVYHSIPKKLSASLSAFEPDLVHVMYGGIMARNVVRCNVPLPVVVSFCGEDLYGTPGHTHYVRNWINLRASREAAKRADGIIVKSRNLRDALPPDIGGRAIKPVAIIPNGIDTTRFACHAREESLARLGWKKDEFHVVFCNNTTSIRKRQWLAEAAVDRLKAERDRVQLHVMDGIPHAEVPHWLSAGDVLLVTSMREGSINIVKEALACNSPIVSVDVGDVAERIEGVEGCYLADPTPDDLAAKLRLVAERGARTNGRQAVEELTIEHVAHRIHDFYQRVHTAWQSRGESSGDSSGI